MVYSQSKEVVVIVCHKEGSVTNLKAVGETGQEKHRTSESKLTCPLIYSAFHLPPQPPLLLASQC